MENESNEERPKQATDHEFNAEEWETPTLNGTLTQCLLGLESCTNSKLLVNAMISTFM